MDDRIRIQENQYVPLGRGRAMIAGPPAPGDRPRKEHDGAKVRRQGPGRICRSIVNDDDFIRGQAEAARALRQRSSPSPPL